MNPNTCEIKIGEFRHRIRIEQNTGTARDAGGHIIPDWTEYNTVWGSFEQVQADETQRSKQTQYNTKNIVQIYYLAGVTEEMRVVIKGTTYDITRVNNVQMRNIKHVIEC